MNCRLCALCCALALAFSLSACSGDKPITHASPTPAPTPSVSPTPSPSPSASEPAPEITPEPSPVPTPTESAGPDAAPVGAQLPGAWNDREAQVSFGMSPGTNCPLAVFDARVGLNDLSVSLVPLGSGPDIQSFLEADIRIPHTSVSYDSGADALVLRLENTVLETGDPAEAAGNDDWVFDFIGEHGLRYPHSFPMGSIGEDNRFFERAAISTDGTDTTITLRLTGKAMSYRVESGSLDGEGMLPYFRILFSEAPA